MNQLKTLTTLFLEFKNVYKHNSQRAGEILSILKKGFASFSTFLPSEDFKDSKLTEEQRHEILLCRETLEYAILFCVLTKDLKSFERHYQQVRMYYDHHFDGVNRSDRESLIIGLNLLRLLSQNKIAAFHAELELIPIEQHGNMYIKHPIDLEIYLMEGSYQKIVSSRAMVPASEYLIFMDILMETIREEIADSMEAAYDSRLSLERVKTLLFLEKGQDVVDFVSTKNKKSKRMWSIQQDNDGSKIVDFSLVKQRHHQAMVTETSSSYEESSRQLIKKTLSYAKEMERII